MLPSWHVLSFIIQLIAFSLSCPLPIIHFPAVLHLRNLQRQTNLLYLLLNLENFRMPETFILHLLIFCKEMCPQFLMITWIVRQRRRRTVRFKKAYHHRWVNSSISLVHACRTLKGSWAWIIVHIDHFTEKVKLIWTSFLRLTFYMRCGSCRGVYNVNSIYFCYCIPEFLRGYTK